MMRWNAIFIAVVLVVCGLGGCGTMMAIFSDNIRYSISGRVYSTTEAQAPETATGIPDVRVEVACPGVESSVYQNRKGVTDQNGYYRLAGNWELEGCKAIFEHHGYKRVKVAIEPSHLVESKGLSRTYELSVRLEPKIGRQQ